MGSPRNEKPELDLLPLALAACLAQGCASTAGKMSFTQAGFEPSSEPPPRVVAVPPNLPVRKVAPKPAVLPPEEEIEAEGTEDGGPVLSRLVGPLTRFSARERSLRAQAAEGAGAPRECDRLWSEVLSQVDAFLRQAPAETSPLDVIRARVTLDAELDFDARRYHEMPEGLRERVKERVRSLSARLEKAKRVMPPPAKKAPGELTWPVSPVVVSSLFGRRLDPMNGEPRRHLGIDLAAEEGQLVTTSAPGIVIRAEWVHGHGLHVEVQHEGGLITRYSHLSKLLVVPGIELAAGGPVGLAGSTGRSTGPHLHFEIWRNGRPKDPLAELGDPAFTGGEGMAALW